MTTNVFEGTIPALMTPCKQDRTPDFDALVRKGRELVALGMRAVVYCGSMGDWPLLTEAQRQEGVARLVAAACRPSSARGPSTRRRPCRTPRMPRGSARRA